MTLHKELSISVFTINNKNIAVLEILILPYNRSQAIVVNL